jgi:hypothetical protein
MLGNTLIQHFKLCANLSAAPNLQALRVRLVDSSVDPYEFSHWFANGVDSSFYGFGLGVPFPRLRSAIFGGFTLSHFDISMLQSNACLTSVEFVDSTLHDDMTTHHPRLRLR